MSEKIFFKDDDYPSILVLQHLLEKIPFVDEVMQVCDDISGEGGIDYVLRVRADNKTYLLACELKKNGQPRYVRAAIKSLKAYMYGRNDLVTPVLIAPYLSAESRQLCAQNEVAFLDTEGNALIQFGGIFIDHRMPGKPMAEKRGLRAMFSPKSAQVLRTMLTDPLKKWRVTELADAARVSLGHVSNVRKNLLIREWAVSSDGGLSLSRPGVLVDEWRESYRPFPGLHREFYTTLHGNGLESTLREILGCDDKNGHVLLSSFSAAQWISPYARTGMHYFLADDKGLDKMKNVLKLSPVSKGSNVVVTVPDDHGVFLDAIEPAPGIFTTGLVQTYLDLSVQGERGQEAAEHLRNEWMNW